MQGLTKKQHAVLSFIQDYIHHNRYSPSYRDIQEKFGFSSLGTVYNYLNILKRKGTLTSQKQSSRSLSLPHANPYHSEIVIPFIGHVKAGFPIEMLAKPQTVAIPHSLVNNPESTYALRVKGDSLAEELIADGDLLIVETKQEIDEGATIIGLINSHDTVIKRCFWEEHYIRLESKTAHHRPLIVREGDLEVQGCLIAILRRFN